jgi:hypothetical protein
MTITELKEVLQDRLGLTMAGLSAMKQTDEADGYAINHLEGRVEEARVALRLVEQLNVEESV